MSQENCVFCDIIARKSPAFIVYEDDNTMAFLDKYPQSRGHLQFVPKKHFRWVYEIPDIQTFFATAQRLTRDIIPVLGANHVSWITYGAEIRHAHLWIVPRYASSSEIREGIRGSSQIEEQQKLQKVLRNALAGGGV